VREREVEKKVEGDDDDADGKNSFSFTFASSSATPRRDSSPTESARSENDLPLAREVTATPARLFYKLRGGVEEKKRRGIGFVAVSDGFFSFFFRRAKKLRLLPSFRELWALLSLVDTADDRRDHSPLQYPVEHREDERPAEQEEPHFFWLRAKSSSSSSFLWSFAVEFFFFFFFFFRFNSPHSHSLSFFTSALPLSARVFLALPYPRERARSTPQTKTQDRKKCSPPWLPPAASLPLLLLARPPPTAAARMSRPWRALPCASRRPPPSPRPPALRSSSRESGDGVGRCSSARAKGAANLLFLCWLASCFVHRRRRRLFSHRPLFSTKKKTNSSSADLYKKFDELLDATTFAPQSGDKITGTVSR